MKTKRLLPLLLAATLLAAGCTSNETSDPADNSSSAETSGAAAVTDAVDTIETAEPADAATIENTAPTAEAATTEVPATEEAAQTAESGISDEKTVFEAGTWLLYDVYTDESIPTGYCFMNEDGVSGSALLYQDKTNVSFEYEIGVNEVNVTIDGESFTVAIVGGDPAYAMFESDFGRSDMIYLSEATEADMPEFYSDVELYEMAQEYYTAKTGTEPSGAASWTNQDGTVSIELDVEDEIVAAYTVDRWSTVGTDDITGEEINFLDLLLQQGE